MANETEGWKGAIERLHDETSAGALNTEGWRGAIEPIGVPPAAGGATLLQMNIYQGMKTLNGGMR